MDMTVRGRALTRLMQEYPERFQELYEEELGRPKAWERQTPQERAEALEKARKWRSEGKTLRWISQQFGRSNRYAGRLLKEAEEK